MLTVTIEGKEHQVPLDAIKAPEGYAIVTPDAEPPAGLVRQNAVESIVKTRVHQAKQSALKEAVEDSGVVAQVLSKFNIQLHDGKPVGVGETNVDEIKRNIHKELKSEFDKESGRIKKENERFKQSSIMSELKSAALSSGVKGGLADLVAQSFAHEFGVTDDLSVAVKDTDGFKLTSDGKHLDAKAFFAQLKADPTRADLFDNTPQKGGYAGKDPINLGTVKSKKDLPDAKAKSAYIMQFGSEAYQNLT